MYVEYLVCIVLNGFDSKQWSKLVIFYCKNSSVEIWMEQSEYLGGISNEIIKGRHII